MNPNQISDFAVEINKMVILMEQPTVLVFAIPFVIGLLLKKSPIPDWVIPWVVTLSGIAIGLIYLGGRVGAGVGFCVAAFSVWGHQIWKQTSERSKNDNQSQCSTPVQKVLIALLSSSLLFSGCASDGSNSVGQTIEDIQAKTVAFLKDPSTPGKLQADLITGGLEAMRLASPEDQKKFASEMYQGAGAINTLVTGQIFTTSQLISTMRAFNPNANTPGYLKYVSDVGAFWAQLYPYLKTSDDVKIAVNYLMALINAANAVGAAYKED